MGPSERKKQAAAWLLGWFGARGTLPGSTTGEQLQADFFEAGLVDSLGIMELIAAVEEHFGIRFSQEHFQRGVFFRIDGLSSLIAGLQHDTDPRETTDGQREP